MPRPTRSPRYYRLNHAIHDAINAAARNPALTQIHQQLNARLQALRFRSNFDHDQWDVAVREHNEMIDALSTRDGPRLHNVLQQHVLNKCVVVIGQLRAQVDQHKDESRHLSMSSALSTCPVVRTPRNPVVSEAIKGRYCAMGVTARFAQGGGRTLQRASCRGNCLKVVVGRAGIEPATNGLRVRCSTS